MRKPGKKEMVRTGNLKNKCIQGHSFYFGRVSIFEREFHIRRICMCGWRKQGIYTRYGFSNTLILSGNMEIGRKVVRKMKGKSKKEY